MIHPTSFDVGRWVRHIPASAQGDPSHPDCRTGRITKIDGLLVLVRLGPDDNKVAGVEIPCEELWWEIR